MCDADVGGLSLNFFKSVVLEQEQPNYPNKNAQIIARNILRVLMMGQDLTQDMLSFQFLQAVFIKRDPKLLAGMRHGFKEGFEHIFSQLENRNLNNQQNNQAQLFLSNCLCFLPFANIRPYDTFDIPQLIHHQWQLITYKVTPIELTPTRGIETLFMLDEDRVFAYGLEPVDAPLAEPHLIFMGTTYPAGQGFVSQVNSDLAAFETVGASLYRTGYKNMTAWLDKQQNKAHVCGTSLGGSLALLLAIHQGAKLSRVDALNPAGLYEGWQKSEFDVWNDLDTHNKPDVFIQKQGDDPVSFFGVWKNDWSILHVTPLKKASSAWLDHALNYAGLAGTIFKKINTIKDNETRYVRNALLYNFARAVIYYLGVLPYHYLIRPALHYVYEHIVELVLFSLALACMAAFMPVNMVFLVVLTPIVLHVVYTLVMSSDVWMGRSDLPDAKLHVHDEEEYLEEIQEENCSFI